MMSKKIYEYMEEIVEKDPESFAEYFFEDIFDYVFPENYDDSQELADSSVLGGEKQKLLLACSSNREVKRWMNDVASFVVMRLDVSSLINDYFEKEGLHYAERVRSFCETEKC